MLFRGEINGLRHQQSLDFELPSLHPGFQLFVEDAFMQGMLIDDQHAITFEYYQVAVMKLQGSWAIVRGRNGFRDLNGGCGDNRGG